MAIDFGPIDDNNPIYVKAVEVLEKGLTPEEFIKLQDQMDGDGKNGFFWCLTKRLAELAPELFMTVDAKDEQAVRNVMENIPVPQVPTPPCKCIIEEGHCIYCGSEHGG